MKIKFNEEEVKALNAMGIQVKDDYSEEDLCSMEDLVGQEVMKHYDANDNPTPQALLCELIIDKIVGPVEQEV